MQDFPHHHLVSANAEAAGTVALKSDNMPQIVSAPPAEFGGPGDQWSPEHLLVASVADCFILTFRAISSASKMEWVSLEATAEGVLDKVERAPQFTAFTVKATLTVPAGTDEAKARRLLDKAEGACMITNSMKAPCHLNADIVFAS